MRRLVVLLVTGLLCVVSAQTALAATQEAQASKWVITTYVWDDGWVEHASWETSNHGDAVKIHVDGWNWSPEYPALTVQYDNVRAFGDVDLATGPDGLLDDFEDGIIAPFWSISSSLGASVTETGGALRVDIPAGPRFPGPGPSNNHVASAETGFVLHGEFDVQVDFAVNPGFHQSGFGAANAKLFLVDGAGNALEASIRSGLYVSLELLAGGSGPIFQHITPTDDQAGRFRIVKAPADMTPPVITVPDDITVNATSPAGRVVEFAATATDENPANPIVTCTPPPGSMFEIGDTLVECAATDAAGNVATKSFMVHVKGPAEQLRDLGETLMGVGPGTSLADKVNAAQAALAAGDESRACEMLRAFINQVTAQSGKTIPPSTATSLIIDASRIRAVLGCI